MKKTISKHIALAMGAAIMLSSCGTYTGSGAYVGGSLGSVLGSAIGGLSGGPRGSDIGTIVGMAGGAVVGAAVGQAQDAKAQERRQADLEQYRRDKAARQQARQQRNNGYDSYDANPSGFDANGAGDDRLYDFQSSDYTGSYTAQQPVAAQDAYAPSSAYGYAGAAQLDIVGARFVDGNANGRIDRGETSKIIFEVRNVGQRAAYDVVPTVVETTGNRHIMVSPPVHVELIEAGRGIRYTALVRADRRLKPGAVRFRLSAAVGNRTASRVVEFNIPTAK